MSLKVLVVEPDAASLAGIEQLLRRRRFLVFGCENSYTTSQLLTQQSIDVVVGDFLDDSRLCCDSFIAQIRATLEWTPIIALLNSFQAKHKVQYFRNGVTSYIHKPFYTTELIAQIKSVYQQQIDFRNYLQLKPDHGEEKLFPVEVKLCPRELSVAGLVARGLSNAEIAQQLYLSKRTVEAHLQRVFCKCNLRNRTEITRWFLEHQYDRVLPKS
ncbi:MAG: response regulator transcription factor [Merismopedia sp. SIO2A8]|nr:response regulator transcription factor [Merismopedia sp. SIO2A8]